MGSLRSLMRRERPEPVAPPRPSDEEVIMAAYTGEIGQLKALLAHGANPNATDGNCESALGIAVLHGEIEMIRLLLRCGAETDQRNACGFTALHLAVSSYLQSAAPEICDLLLDCGADVNACSPYGWTPLMVAIDHEEYDSAKILLERGADATLRRHDGKRAVDLLGRGKGHKALRKLLGPVS